MIDVKVLMEYLPVVVISSVWSLAVYKGIMFHYKRDVIKYNKRRRNG